MDWFDTDASVASTTMRTRLWLRAALPQAVTAFVQIQDVRTWGVLSWVFLMADVVF